MEESEKIRKYKIDLVDGSVFINTDYYGEDELFAYADTVKEVKEILKAEGNNHITLGQELKKMAKNFKASDANEIDY